MPALPDGPAKERLLAAIDVEARGHRALLDGDARVATLALDEAAALYRQSWELAGPGAFGRLVGHLKAAVLAGTDAIAAARYVRGEIPDAGASPVATYALAVAALVLGLEAIDTAPMHERGEAFARTATALDALARGDAAAYADALRAIVADFEGRDAHLTGVPIADTALLLERLAAPRGLAAGVTSPLLPPA